MYACISGVIGARAHLSFRLSLKDGKATFFGYIRSRWQCKPAIADSTFEMIFSTGNLLWAIEKLNPFFKALFMGDSSTIFLRQKCKSLDWTAEYSRELWRHIIFLKHSHGNYSWIDKKLTTCRFIQTSWVLFMVHIL